MIKRILSALLVAVMLFGACAGLIPMTAVNVQAAEIQTSDATYERVTAEALKQSYDSLKEKLFGFNKDPYMQKVLTVNLPNGGDTYQLYCSPFTGEVIYYNATKETGISTNPYDLGSEETGEISDVVKAQLLSQVVVSYKGKDGNLKYMYSFTEAAQRGQIQVKSIKNGIRVQYSIGRENATYLMPGWITKQAFEEKIVAPLDAYKEEISALYDGQLRYTSGAQRGAYTPYGIFMEEIYNKIVPDGVTYTLQDPNKPGAVKETMFKNYPITAKIDDETGTNYAIYVVSESLTAAQKSRIEALIKTYCPNYTYEDVQEDNDLTGYVSKAETPPFFKLALEYTINPTDGALDIRLPANGILYDETLFELEYISTLNYLGAGKMDTTTYGDYLMGNGVYGGDAHEEMLYDGYVFYPDGSGALFEYSDLYTDTKKTSVAWSGKVYGQDYAYYTVSGQHQEPVRLPVYGVVSTEDVVEVPMTDAEGNQLYDERNNALYDIVPVKSGFLAILEEGDAMTSLSVSFGAARHNYASVYPTYYPRPKDTYDLADSVSVSGNTEWTVVADRKYTGSYRTRIELLSGSEASWVGMATAYRDYLKECGTLKPLAEGASQIPLYIEAFGALETTKQILSFPVDVKVPLTTFDDVALIYDDLKGVGISNINFKLTGFANGGMAANYPAKLKWERAVGGKRGFRELIEKAADESFGVYPEFDFTYLSNQSSGDGVSLKKIGSRTVDNRYCSKQIYDAVYQQFTSFFDMCVATNLINTYYEKLASKLEKYEDDGVFGLSLSTLGSDLNSNFDEDNPINREQAKEDVRQLLENVASSYSVMLSGGNRYTLDYADHILSMPLDSSKYRYASASVPFMAMVLHGYVNYTGAALNMSGDSEYNVLKSIENGAYPYFLLSYNTENTMLLKKDESLNKYYSIRYDIWRWKDPDEKTGDGTIVEQYRTLNAALADLQTAELVDHIFIRGERNLKDYEKEENKQALREAVLSGVMAEIAARETALFNAMKTERDIFLSAEKNDGDFCSFIEAYVTGGYNITVDPTHKDWAKHFEGMEDPAEIAAKKAELEAEAALQAVLKDFEDALAADGVAKSYAAQVFAAYLDGDGLEDLGVKLGLKVKVNADVDAIIAKADAFIGTALSDAEKAALWTDVRALIAANTDTDAGEAIFDALKVILGKAPTDADAALFNKLVYAGYGNDKIIAKAAGFSATLTDAKKTELAALVTLCRDTYGYIVALVNDVTVDFDFNKTNSEATDGTNYVDTDYTLKDERLVMVTYRKADGKLVRFVLNYNLFDVTVRIDGEEHVIPSYSFKRLDPATNS